VKCDYYLNVDSDAHLDNPHTLRLLIEQNRYVYACACGHMCVIVTGRGRPKFSEVNLFHCHFVHQEFHMGCPGIEPGCTW